MSSMHALHKIIAERTHPRRTHVTAGEVVEIEPDFLSVFLSPNGADARKLMADLEELGVTELPLKDRIFAVSDHGSPAPTAAFAASQKLWRDFYRARGVKVFDGGAGVSHLVMCEEGIALPGTLGIALDSHGPTMGAVGMYAAALSGRLSLFAIGRYFLEVPKVTLVKVHGSAQLSRGVYGRDASLYVNGQLGQRGASGTAVEFAGPFIDALSMDMRFTFANMGVELGAVASYIQPDETTLDWVRPRAKHAFKVYETDEDFAYDRVHDVDISGIEPQIAAPHKPDNVMPVSKVAGRKVDQAYLGSCASGRLEDMAAAAAVLKGRKVHPDVRFVVTPGSREILLAATRAGYVEIFHEAHAIVTNANCGACPGHQGGLLGPGEVAITSITRNFEGRMGPGAEIYLASPATVAASAIEGRIASPRDYL